LSLYKPANYKDKACLVSTNPQIVKTRHALSLPKKQKIMKLIINKKTFDITKATLPKLDAFADQLWQREIVQFLQLWFDSPEYVEQKTSGSTGTPKRIRLLKETMLRSAGMTNAFLGLNEQSVSLLCLPASYIAGKMMLVRAIAGNYTLIAVEPSANPFEGKKYPPLDFTAITPYQLVHSAKALSKFKISNIIVGGSQVTPEMEKLISSWPMRVFETFGMTETASHIALRRLNGVERSNYFHTLEGVELSLDKRGCLVIQAPHLTKEQLITNDLAELKDAHTFRWLGRIDRVINTGGVKIFAEQVERKLQTLLSKPHFIAGMPNEALGQQVALVIESPDLPDEQLAQLHASMKGVLDRFEVPGRIICVPKFVYSEGNKLLREETLSRI
jgi:O-succinylbenzoic acid--CoA ligase